MFLSKTLHTELLKAAEQNGVNKMLTWGGVGAGVGGAYGMFSDTGTTMEGAFKGAILGGGAAAGLKYYGNKYATGMMHTGNFVKTPPSFNGLKDEAFNDNLNMLQDLGRLTSGFEPRFIGIGGKAKFSDNVLGAISYNNKLSQQFSAASLDFDAAVKASGMTREGFISKSLDKYERSYATSMYSKEIGDAFSILKNQYNPGA
jgi:hypothetical protein